MFAHCMQGSSQSSLNGLHQQPEESARRVCLVSSAKQSRFCQPLHALVQANLVSPVSSEYRHGFTNCMAPVLANLLQDMHRIT